MILKELLSTLAIMFICCKIIRAEDQPLPFWSRTRFRVLQLQMGLRLVVKPTLIIWWLVRTKRIAKHLPLPGPVCQVDEVEVWMTVQGLGISRVAIVEHPRFCPPTAQLSVFPLTKRCWTQIWIRTTSSPWILWQWWLLPITVWTLRLLSYRLLDVKVRAKLEKSCDWQGFLCVLSGFSYFVMCGSWCQLFTRLFCKIRHLWMMKIWLWVSVSFGQIGYKLLRIFLILWLH